VIYFWTILLYLFILIFVGAWRSGQVKNQDDFMVAGRRLSAKVLVGTLLATWIGSGSIIAGAGLAYDKGFSSLWFDAGVWVAIIILFLIAGRVRAFAQYTVPDILETRYNKYARILGTVVTVIAYTAIVSYQFRAGGRHIGRPGDNNYGGLRDRLYGSRGADLGGLYRRRQRNHHGNRAFCHPAFSAEKRRRLGGDDGPVTGIAFPAPREYDSLRGCRIFIAYHAPAPGRIGHVSTIFFGEG